MRTIAHGVRNPLGSIRLGTQLLQHTETEADAPVGTHSGKVQLSQKEIREYTAIIIKEVDRLNRFIEQLLAFSKPAMQAAKQVDIHQLLRSSLATCRPELEHHAIKVDTQYDSNCPQLKINEDGITQVLLNLFYNAIEAMDTGGTLTIQTKYLSETEVVRVRVQDDGPGILTEDIPMLFDPFYTTKQKGTGLGLYISQKILAEHQGSIEIDANLETGTAFIVSLPIH